MNWVTPKYSTKQVDSAGKILALSPSGDEPLARDHALQILNNWRAVHAYPLNTMQLYLRKAAYNIDRKSIVAQRLKKLSSILFKIRRMPSMELSRMQDIGGCRAILSSVRSVRKVYNWFIRSRMRHTLANQKDYITEPKKSEYRGIHLVYRYNSDKRETFNNLLIEVQLRTKLQHLWATTVETVGLFLNESLKSSIGSAKWLRFFALSSSLFAIKEKCPLVPETPTDLETLIQEINSLVKELNVYDKLQSYKVVVDHIFRRLKEARYFLLYLRFDERRVTISPYRVGEIEAATAEYLEIEKGIGDTGNEVVLVSSDSFEHLRTAYPNLFVDTTQFARTLEKLLK